MVVGFLANHSRRHEAVSRAPHVWLAQLEDMGVYDPAAHVVRGGTGDVLANWARSERLHPEEALTTAVQILAHLRSASRVSVLIDPPNAWGATNVGLSERIDNELIDDEGFLIATLFVAGFG